MTIVNILENYQDDHGNQIIHEGVNDAGIRITFSGSNNRLIVAPDAKLRGFNVDFDCDNGHFEIGGNDSAPAFSGSFRVGQDATILIGRNVSSTTGVHISSVEGNTVTIGDDVMFASGNEIRGDDGHPIFDVYTGKRVNTVQPIIVGNHVWVGGRAVILSGVCVIR